MANERLLAKIRGLLAKANSTEYPEERDSCLAIAERMMQQHEIDMAMLDASRPGMQRSVTKREIEVARGEFEYEMASLLVAFANHRNVRTTTRYAGNGKSVRVLMGFEDDLGFVELMYTTAMLDFSSKLTPAWSQRSAVNQLEFDRSVRAFKEAGYKWVEIAKIANKHGGNPKTGMDGSTTDGAWLKAAYRRECVRVGVAPTRQTQRHAAFRATFATGFVQMINTRLFKMRHDHEQASGVISGNLPAVRESRERVDEKFYEAFPNMRPLSDEEMAERHSKAKAERDEEIREREEFLAKLTPSQLDEFLRKEERRDAAQQRKWDREDRARFDESGFQAGQRAAKQVDLSGGANHLVGKKEIE